MGRAPECPGAARTSWGCQEPGSAERTGRIPAGSQLLWSLLLRGRAAGFREKMGGVLELPGCPDRSEAAVGDPRGLPRKPRLTTGDLGVSRTALGRRHLRAPPGEAQASLQPRVQRGPRGTGAGTHRPG